MALKNLFDTMKHKGYVIKPWEEYLLKKQDKKSDRAINVNAPSQIGSCVRARYYGRIGIPAQKYSAKTERVFNNGTYVHERIQKDLFECGILPLDEVPVFDDEHNIQGHTDGILKLGDNEYGILEIKSINARNFAELKAAKEEHVMQGLTYLYCVEKHRQLLRKSYRTNFEFALSWEKERKKIYTMMYNHLIGGSSFSRAEKLEFQLDLHREMDKLLFYQSKPITKAIFLYECKDNQDLKEFVVDSTSKDSKHIIETILKECDIVNEAVEAHTPPPRPEGAKKSCGMCRWCNYQNECFVV